MMRNELESPMDATFFFSGFKRSYRVDDGTVLYGTGHALSCGKYTPNRTIFSSLSMLKKGGQGIDSYAFKCWGCAVDR